MKGLWRRLRCRPRKMIIHHVRRWGTISRCKSSGNEEDTFFEPCCAGPYRFQGRQNLAQSPGCWQSSSQPEFLREDDEPQTVEQHAPLVVARRWDAGAAVPPYAGAAATLVRESDGPHGVVQVAPPCAGAAVAGGRRLPVGCFDGDAFGASLLRACSAGANVHCDESSGAPLVAGGGAAPSAGFVAAHERDRHGSCRCSQAVPLCAGTVVQKHELGE